MMSVTVTENKPLGQYKTCDIHIPSGHKETKVLNIRIRLLLSMSCLS